MTRSKSSKPRRKRPWKQPHEIQAYPKASGQRVQIRQPDGRCRILHARQVDWANIIEWRWA